MVLVQESYTAAVAAAGANLAEGKWWQSEAYGRVLKQIALVGSTAIGDCKIELSIGSKKIIEIFNTTAGASKVPLDADRKYVNEYVPRNTPIHVKVTDAANTEAIVLELKFDKPRYRSSYGNSTWGARRSYGSGYRRF